MPKSLVYRELVLHSPSVLLPRTARLYAKLTRELGRVPESLVHGELVLHSSSVLLPRTARLYAKLTRGLGRVPKSLVYRELVLHSSSVIYASLQFGGKCIISSSAQVYSSSFCSLTFHF